MRRSTSILLLLLALLLAVVPMGAARTRRGSTAGPCRPGHRRLIAVDTKAQAYAHLKRSSEVDELYACAYGHKSYQLGPAPEIETGGVELVTLNDTMVAYQSSGFSKYTSFAVWLIVVRDLRTGRIVHEVPNGTLVVPPKEPGSAGIGPTRAIVVKNDGAVAWIAENSMEEEVTRAPYYEVHALDKSGGRVVAAGNGIAPHSLALAGSTIYWTQDGQPFSATLN